MTFVADYLQLIVCKYREVPYLAGRISLSHRCVHGRTVAANDLLDLLLHDLGLMNICDGEVRHVVRNCQGDTTAVKDAHIKNAVVRCVNLTKVSHIQNGVAHASGPECVRPTFDLVRIAPAATSFPMRHKYVTSAG